MSNSGLSANSSPTPRIPESESPQSSNVNKFMTKIKLSLEAESKIERSNRELHLKRVQNLRKQLEYLKSTEWKYQTVDRNLDYGHRN